MHRIEKYLPEFQMHYKNRPEIPKVSRYTCAIVEPRKHPHLELAIKNVLYYIPQTWSIYVFHSQENQEFVRQILLDKIDQINLICISKGNLFGHDYSTLLTSELFWNWIDAEFVLIFQTDTYLRKYGIEKWIKKDYDYIGAPWQECSWMNACSKQAGNGGLSLRKKSKMLEIIQNNVYSTHMTEDFWFHQQLLANPSSLSKLADNKEAEEFSVESIYHPDPLGVHKYWAYIIDIPGTLCLLEGLDSDKYGPDCMEEEDWQESIMLQHSNIFI